MAKKAEVLRTFNTENTKMMLTADQAADIYMLKISVANSLGSLKTANQSIRGKSNAIAARYKVSSRTIRDIWNRKTWSYATQHLWPLDGFPSVANCKQAIFVLKSED